MVKTLSSKVTDEMYHFVDGLPGSHSYHLVKALEEYLEHHYGYKKNSQEKGGIPIIYSDPEDDEGNDSNNDSMSGIHSYIDNLKDMKDKNKL
jgi:hypothetical protein